MFELEFDKGNLARRRVCGDDEFIDFSAHLELGLETRILGKIFYYSTHGKIKIN